jgi:hypothetical protein
MVSIAEIGEVPQGAGALLPREWYIVAISKKDAALPPKNKMQS